MRKRAQCGGVLCLHAKISWLAVNIKHQNHNQNRKEIIDLCLFYSLTLSFSINLYSYIIQRTQQRHNVYIFVYIWYPNPADGRSRRQCDNTTERQARIYRTANDANICPIEGEAEEQLNAAERSVLAFATRARGR